MIFTLQSISPQEYLRDSARPSITLLILCLCLDHRQASTHPSKRHEIGPLIGISSKKHASMGFNGMYPVPWPQAKSPNRINAFGVGEGPAESEPSLLPQTRVQPQCPETDQVLWSRLQHNEMLASIVQAIHRMPYT